MTKGPHPRRRVLLVDNYDSYTGNLLQLLWCETGARPDLVESDRIDLASVDAYSHIVLGPGPGTPHRADDVGRALDLLAVARVPVLGVCLGFQTMAVALGGSVVPAPRPAHGRVDVVAHDGSSVLLADIPRTFEATRYHSLAVADPAPLRITARTADGVAMAGEDPERGWFGVQFHPESIGTPHGAAILSRFLHQEGAGDE
ncbi:anthranilate synthase component II [Microbacterium sp. NPDC055683]